MNSYETKQEARRERLLRAADRAEQGRTDAFNRAHSYVAGIPFGQPILVGHHSEGRHRNALKKQENAMRRGIELGKLAEDLRRRAAGVGDAGISSDDPDAIEKLDDKRTDLEQQRDLMKAANVFYKKMGTLEGMPGLSAELYHKGISVLKHQAYYNAPFPSYALSNIGARIRDAAKRAKRIEAIAATPASDETINSARVVVDPDENRVLLTFPARLSKDDYKRVRSGGFVWSPTRSAFVRKLSGRALYNARELARTLPTPNVGTSTAMPTFKGDV